MKKSEAAKYSRWSAGIALLLAAITLGVFAERAWVRHVERENAPPPAPRDVERLSTGITFSKMEENQAIFTVEASKSTDFKGENATLLQDVKITIFGKDGRRHDTLHTKSCRFSKEKGDIVCTGEVQIDLLSAADAAFLKSHPEEADARTVRVETRGVTFQRASGLAQTDQPVSFHFPNGEGQAIGARYDSDEGALRLDKDVRIKVLQTPASRNLTDEGQEVEIMGSQLDFARDTRVLTLKGPARAETPQERLTAGLFRLDLDEDFRAKDLDAVQANGVARPELFFHTRGSGTNLEADSFHAVFSPFGSVESLEAVGNLQGSLEGTEINGTLKAARAGLELWPRVNQPKILELNGDVDLRIKNEHRGESQELQTESLRVSFSQPAPHERSRPSLAETLGPGNLTLLESGTSTPAVGPRQTKIQADRLALDFGASGKARRMTATKNVRVERRVQGKEMQTATAQDGWVDLHSPGGWSQMGLEGNVRLSDGDRTGRAEHALFERSPETAILAGHASVRDSAESTTAARITFTQGTGEMKAEGNVHSVDFSAKSSGVSLAPALANMTSDKLSANTKTGHALYSGHARFWQGDAVLEAGTILLERDRHMLTATEKVRAVFPQKAAAAKNGSAQKKIPILWHVTAGKLLYWDKENRAHLEDKVRLQAAGERMRSDKLDLYFSRAATSANDLSSGIQQISRAVADGNVIVEEGTRRASANHGEYSAADGKFVMSGGNPTIFDASSGTTTGRQLTFFLTDDTIIVDSENGSRTLTKHRVEN